MTFRTRLAPVLVLLLSATAVAQQQLAPVGGWQMNIDHLDGSELLESTARGQSRRQRMQATLQRDLQAISQERHENVSFNSLLPLMVDRAQSQIALEVLEGFFHLHQLGVELPEPGRGLPADGRYPEHVRKLASRHLDADPGQEPDQDGAGQEVRQKPEPGRAGQQQQRADQQGRQPGQAHVLQRPDRRQAGERGREDDGGRRVSGNDEVA